MKNAIRKTFALAMTAATLLAVPAASMGVSAVEDTNSVQTASASDVTYTENHSIIDCANYYIDGDAYRFLIKLPKNASISTVTISDVYSPNEVKLSDIGNESYSCYSVYYQYSDSTSDYYMYSLDCSKFYAPKYSAYYYGIKVYYDNGNEHYMATNTSNNSTTEGPGYNLGTVL